MLIKKFLSKRKVILFLIFFLAFGLRFWVVIHIPENLKKPAYDAEKYDRLAVDLLAGKGLVDEIGRPSSYRTPVYPLFLAGVYFLFGHNWPAVRVLQCFLGAFLPVIMYILAAIFLEEKVAILISFITAVYAPFILYSFFGGPVFLLSENLFILFLALSVLFFARGLYVRACFSNLFLTGLFLGLATLTRPASALLIVPFLFFVYRKGNGAVPAAIKGLLPLIAGMLMLILPWTIRNYMAQGEFIPLSTQGGMTFYCGNNPSAKGGWGSSGMPYTEDELKRHNVMSETERQRIWFKSALSFLRDNPQRIPMLLIKKPLAFWMPFMEGEKYNLAYAIIFSFAVLGLFNWRYSRRQGPALLLLPFGYFTFMAIVFYGDPRFRYPVEPYLIIFSAIGINWLWRRKHRVFSRIIFLTIFLLHWLIYIFWDQSLSAIKGAVRLFNLS